MMATEEGPTNTDDFHTYRTIPTEPTLPACRCMFCWGEYPDPVCSDPSLTTAERRNRTARNREILFEEMN